jgi:hypothetical protein
LFLKGLHLLLRAEAYIYMYSLLIIRPLLYGPYGRRCSALLRFGAVNVQRCRSSPASCCRLLSTTVKPLYKDTPYKDILTNKDNSISPPTFSRGKQGYLSIRIILSILSPNCFFV